MSAPFLMWYDDNPKLPMSRKIEDAIGAYRHRWPSSAPTLVLVNEEEVTEVSGVEVRGVTTIRRNTVWVGLSNEQAMDEPAPAVAPKPRRRKTPA